MNQVQILSLFFALLLTTFKVSTHETGEGHTHSDAGSQAGTGHQNEGMNENDEHYINGMHNPNYNHTEEQMIEHRKDFDFYDFDKDGILDAQELRQSSENVTEKEIADFFDIADKDEDGMVTFEEYLAAALEAAEREKPEENLEPADNDHGSHNDQNSQPNEGETVEGSVTK